MNGVVAAGRSDLTAGLKRLDLAMLMAIDGLKRAHRRTELGILWLIVPQAVMVTAFILIFTQVFQQRIEGFPLYIGTGLLVWNYIATFMTGSPGAVLQNGRWIMSQPLPVSTLVYSFVIQAFIQFIVCLPIYLVLAVIYLPPLGLHSLLAIPGLAIITVAGLGFSLILAPLGARFRDLGPALGVVSTVGFLITPIIWPAGVVGRRVFFIHGNPFYHLVEIVRQPLMGNVPTAENWIFASCVAAGLLLVGVLLFGWFKRHVYYWIS